jgi:hypothetical protein
MRLSHKQNGEEIELGQAFLDIGHLQGYRKIINPFDIYSLVNRLLNKPVTYLIVILW